MKTHDLSRGVHAIADVLTMILTDLPEGCLPSDDPVCITEVTRRRESIFAHDAQYIRADLVEDLISELESCLMLPANILPALKALRKILPKNNAITQPHEN